VTDAKRFISFFGEAINQSAPHIYLSALALAPEESEITKRFSHEFPQLMTITRGKMKQWPNIIALITAFSPLLHRGLAQIPTQSFTDGSV
jgi:hypothetical protein